MKASLRSKALVLSLSAMIIVGSGCERRGRAPMKSVGAGPTQTLTDANKPSIPVSNVASSTDEKKTSAGKPEISAKESQLVTDAQMNCDVAAIDDTASASKESFKADLDLVNAFQKCMKTGGLVLTLADPDKTRVWSLDASATPEDHSAAFVEFSRIAKDSNDDNAFKIMASRLELSIIRLGKMGTKYSADRLLSSDIKAGDEIDYYQKKITISGTLNDIQKGVAALESARESIKSMKTVVDGQDGTTTADLKTQSVTLQNN